MDTSKEYIEMCEKAQEMQKLRGDGEYWESNDFLAEHIKDMFIQTGCYLQYFGTESFKNNKIIWLPRQDQLQEIIFNDFKDLSDPYFEMMESCYEYENDNPDIPPKTMEKIWLSFIMIKKYGKIWNEKEKIWNKI
jgi:hypothetical protein